MGNAVGYHALTFDTAALLDTADVFDHAIKPDQLAAFLAEPGHHMVLAVLDDTVVVGMASASVMLHPDKSPTLFINEVGVIEAHRRRGIGTELVRRMVEWGEAQGCTGAWLATEHDNHAARALYRGCKGREQTGLVTYDWGDMSEHGAHG